MSITIPMTESVTGSNSMIPCTVPGTWPAASERVDKLASCPPREDGRRLYYAATRPWIGSADVGDNAALSVAVSRDQPTAEEFPQSRHVRAARAMPACWNV